MKIYFASDIHLGAPLIVDKRAHEVRFVEWLDEIKKDADEVYLLGDVFDYWFEYSTVVPRGFVRFLGKICELTDKGIKVHIFTGNHDVWMWDYLPNECGVEVHREHYKAEICGKKILMGHGDEMGYDFWYGILKWIFKLRLAQICYKWVHPDLAGWVATTWSRLSRQKDNRNTKYHTFRGEEEFQVRYARKTLDKEQIDYFVFGHRHVTADYPLNDKSRLIVLGEWMSQCTYAVMEDGAMRLCCWKQGDKK